MKLKSQGLSSMIRAILYFLILGAASILKTNLVEAAALICPPPPPGGDYTVPGDCSFDGTINGIDGGVLTISPGATLTINSGQTIVYTSGSSVSTPPPHDSTPRIVPSDTGQMRKTNLWMLDYRGGGYPDNLTQVASDSSPGAGYVRRNTLVAVPSSSYASLQTVVDCNYATRDFDVSRCPSAITGTYNQSSYLDVIMHGWANSNGRGSMEVWFRYGTTPPTDYHGNRVCNDKFGTSTAHQIVDTGTTLKEYGTNPAPSSFVYGTTYYYCFMARNSSGIYFGELDSFLTPIQVTTEPAESIRTNDALLVERYYPNGIPSTSWFRYSGTSPESCDDSFGTKGTVQSSSSTTQYKERVYDLIPGNTYYFCGMGSNGSLYTPGGSNVLGYGAVLSFNALISPPPTPTPTPTPTLTFNGSPTSVNASTPVVLSWTSTDTTSCAASGNWSGAKGTSGTEGIYPVQRFTSYSLSCSGPGGNSPTRTVNVTLTCTREEKRSGSCPY